MRCNPAYAIFTAVCLSKRVFDANVNAVTERKVG